MELSDCRTLYKPLKMVSLCRSWSSEGSSLHKFIHFGWLTMAGWRCREQEQPRKRLYSELTEANAQRLPDFLGGLSAHPVVLVW